MILQVQGQQRYNIADNIREAIGLKFTLDRWRDIYPCAFVVSFYNGTYTGHGVGLDSLISTEWVDLADLFMKLSTAGDGEP